MIKSLKDFCLVLVSLLSDQNILQNEGGGASKYSLHRSTSQHLRGLFDECGTPVKDEDLRDKSTNEEVAWLIEFVGYRKGILIDDAVS